MQSSQLSTTHIIAQTRQWVETVVIGYQFCPFAHKVFDAETIHYQVVKDQQLELSLQALIAECQKLDNSTMIETTLIIYPQGYADFEYFLELLALATDLLVAQGYEGVYQLASFHPQYQFSDADIDDPANYTNRSPYPMLHILREASIEQASLDFPDADSIPQKNIQCARKYGKKHMAKALAKCSI